MDSIVMYFENIIDFKNINKANVFQSNPNMPLEFIKRYKTKLNWKLVCQYINMPVEFLNEFTSLLDWNTTCKYQTLSIEFMEKHYEFLNWNYVCEYQKLSVEFMDKFNKFLNWKKISLLQHLTMEFVSKYEKKIIWSELTTRLIMVKFKKRDEFKNKFDYHNSVYPLRYNDFIKLCSEELTTNCLFTETFIRKYNSKWTSFDWNRIANIKLSQEFIKEFKLKLTWDCDFIYYYPDEFFIEYKDQINFNSFPFLYTHSGRILDEKTLIQLSDKISFAEITQPLSTQFILQFNEFINWNIVSEMKYLENEIIEEFSEKVNWNNLSVFHDLNFEFLNKFKHKINWKRLCYIREDLPEDLAIRFESYLDFSKFSCYKYSLDFIIKFKHKINFSKLFEECYLIDSKQTKLMNLNFLKETKTYIDFNYLQRADLFNVEDEDIIDEFIDILNLNSIKNIDFSEKFIDKNINYLNLKRVFKPYLWFTQEFLIKHKKKLSFKINSKTAYNHYMYKLKKLVFLQKKITHILYKPNSYGFKKAKVNFTLYMKELKNKK